MKKGLLLIIILGLVLRLINLNQSLWLDEATSIKAANLSVAEIITKFSPGDFHPPLYYLALKIWIVFFGSSEVGVRLLSVLAGTTSIFVLYKIANILFNKKVALVASLFFAMSPLAVYYAQEVRMYSLAMFLSLMVVWTFLRIIREGSKKTKDWLFFVLSSILLFYTNYLATLVLVSIALFLIMNKKEFTKERKDWIVSSLIIFLWMLPWLSMFLKQMEVAAFVKSDLPVWWEVLGKTSLKQIALVPIKFIIGRISFYDKFVYAAFVFIALLPFVAPFYQAIKKGKNTKFLWLWFLTPFALSLLMGIFGSGFSYFRLVFLLPAFCLLTAWGVSLLKNKKLQALSLYGIVLASIVSLTIFNLNPRFHREDWRQAANWVEGNSKGDRSASVFVANSIRDPFLYYSKIIPSFGPDFLDNYDKLYLVRYAQPIFDPEDKLKERVKRLGYDKVTEKDFNGVVIWEYVR